MNYITLHVILFVNSHIAGKLHLILLCDIVLQTAMEINFWRYLENFTVNL